MSNIFFSLHDASHTDFHGETTARCSLDNSQTETMPGIFSATEHIYTGLFTLSQPHHSSDLVDNNAVSLTLS